MKNKAEAMNQKKMKCPTCKAEVGEDEKAFPFCSKRCQVIDLGKWADERFVISRPVEYADLDEE